MPAAKPAPPIGAAWRAWERVELALDALFGARGNPLRHLGALGFLFFWVLLATGLYLYALYESTTDGAYRSVDALSATLIGATVRSLHRYAADGFVAVTVLHLARELFAGRFTGARWFAWVTGVILLWLLYASGIGGYWLPGDQLAQWSLTATAEWLDALPLAGLSIVRNFLSGGQMTDRFYALLAFLHVAIPLTLLFGMWLHIQRVTRPDVRPSRALTLGTLAMLIALSLVKPATSMAPPDYGALPAAVPVDWFLLFVHPLMDATSPAALWGMAALVTLLLGALPWVVRVRREPVALVDPANCNGCGRCFADCPFGAVVVEPRTDGRRGAGLARVLPELCVSCGICAGACPSSTPFRSVAELVTGIDMPQLSLAEMRAALERSLADLEGGPRIIVFGCDRAADVRALARPDTGVISLLCIGQLPPSFIDFALRGGADGVLVTGCAEDGCYYRHGNTWTAQRIAGEREPHLRVSVPRARVRVAWAAAVELGRLGAEIEAFRSALAKLPPAQRAVRRKRKEVALG
ncbi:MAG: cytochrome b N-terminal domain-containing protein [Burkholderiales bacterium]|nr:cytochrome b N-terminal domain-containing protein [Burkholderiales bacterium]